MKIVKTLLVIMGLSYILPSFCWAQTNLSLDYIVLNTGDTLYGKVQHINQRKVTPRFYKKIRLINTRGKQKKYKRADVAAFRVSNVNYEGFWLSQTSRGVVVVNPRYDIDPQNGEKHFLRVINKGKLSHYYLEWWEQGDAGSNWMDLLRKEKDQFLMRATQGLLGLKRKTLAKYFLDCPKLSQQITKRQLRKVEEVVNFYNNHCAY